MGDIVKRQGKDPLRTLEAVVGFIVVLMVTVTGAVLIGTLFGSGSIPGVNAEVCVSTEPGRDIAFQDGAQDSVDTAEPATGPMDLAEGIRWHANEVQLCDPDPDGATRALGVAGLTVWLFAPLLFFVLLWRMLSRARRDGVFADRVPGSLHQLGGFLLVWAALSFVVTGFVNAALISRMTAGDGFTIFSSDNFPWLLVLLGIAFLALEKVMSEAVALREDSEATI